MAVLKIVQPEVQFDEYVVMPNHFQALAYVPPIKDATASRKLSLATLVNRFKGAVTRAASRPVWQRGYHEHIVRNERELELIRTYIRENPVRWAADRYYLAD